jgi:hypothetical protein
MSNLYSAAQNHETLVLIEHKYLRSAYCTHIRIANVATS